MKNIATYIVAAILGSMLVTLGSCSTTRRIPADDHLYTGIKKIVYDAGTDSAAKALPPNLRDDINEAVFVAPNNYWKLLGWRYPFPLGLWVYNNWPNPSHGLKHWIYEKLARDPVLVSDVRPEVRTRMIEEILHNNGYFSGTSSYELVPGRNPKKAAIKYVVNTGPAYLLSSVELPDDTTRMRHLVDSIAGKLPYLRRGSRFDMDSLASVRVAITNSLRNQGYFYFNPDFIEYLADTVATPGQVALRMSIGSNIPDVFMQQYRTGKVTVNVTRHSGHGRYTDTMQLSNATVIRQMPSLLRRSVMAENITFRPGRVFAVRDMDRTQSRLARTGIFSSVSVSTTRDTTAAVPTLNVLVDCVMDRPWEASVEVNATSKSNSYIGPGISLGLTNKNTFGGGEQLSLNLTGAYEWQTGGGNRGGIFNSYEAGITATLAFPRLLAPRFIHRRRRDVNWTRFSLNADLLNRPHFFKMAQFNAAMTYDWRSNRHVSMSLTPMRITYTKLMHTTHDFDSIMAANPAVALSFRSQFIPQMMYTFNLDRNIGPDNNINYSFTVQQAGNLMWSLYELCGKHGEKRLFGTPFSQFVKGQTQIVYSRRVGCGDHWLVSRAAVGAEHAYGNASQVPYAEQFYCGGANSVRAFTVRSIGPGSYRAPHDTASDYFDQTGTFRFEANVEYRFPIAGPLHGAVFLDAGNVWLLKEDPQRPGGLLRGSTFFKDLALGTGAGLRFDISMLVVRGDLGIGIHAPYDTGRSGYYNMTSFGNSLAFHLAIGYPF